MSRCAYTVHSSTIYREAQLQRAFIYGKSPSSRISPGFPVHPARDMYNARLHICTYVDSLNSYYSTCIRNSRNILGRNPIGKEPGVINKNYNYS